MRTTKDEREYLRAKYSRAKDYDDDVRRDVLYLLDDAAAEYLAGQLQRAGLDAADAQAALTTIALAAGLGADATAEEVAKRVRSMLDVVTDQLERDCSYNDACPHGANHGRCDGCRAREAMGLPASIDGTQWPVVVCAGAGARETATGARRARDERLEASRG